MGLRYLNGMERVEREAMIPEAIKHANKVAGRSRCVSAKPEEYSFKWNRAFHNKMEKLAKGEGA